MKQVKKIKLGAMVGGSLIVPLAVVASCSTTSTPIIDDYNIKAKTNPETVYESDVTPDKLNTVETLSLVFDGVNSTNIKNITASLIESKTRAKDYTISLKAKEGYTINNEQSLSSTVFTSKPITILQIEQQKTAPTDIKFIDIENDGFKNLDVLEKLFTNIKETDKANLEDISLSGDTPTPGSTHKVTLTAKRGFVFNVDNKDVSKLESVEFTTALIDLIIAAKQPVDTILNIDIEGDKLQSIETLKKIFTATSDNDFANVEAKIQYPISSPKNVIVLTAKPGYSINGITTLPSEEFDVKFALFIKPVTNAPNDIKFVDLKDGKYMDIAILERLFDGIKEPDKNRMTIEMTNQASIGPHKMTLKADANTVFLDGNNNIAKEISIDFTSVVVKLAISPVNPIPNNITFISLQNNGYKTIGVLQQLFNGIKITDIDNTLEVEITDLTGGSGNHTLTLKSILGNTFVDNGGATNDEISIDLTSVDINLDITRNNNPDTIYVNEVEGEHYKDPEFLAMIFNGIENIDFANIKNIVKNSKQEPGVGGAPAKTLYWITLEAKQGYKINTQSHLSSVEFEANLPLAVLQISRITTPPASIPGADIPDPNKISHAVLSKFFTGLELPEVDHIETKLVDLGDGDYKIKITAKRGFWLAISNQMVVLELESATFKLT
ncbi:MAG: hypothetical protein ACRC1F_00055 [Metamycoplasmataceae bacterium]